MIRAAWLCVVSTLKSGHDGEWGVGEAKAKWLWSTEWERRWAEVD